MSGMSLEDKYDDSPNYYNWVDTYPQLKILLDNLDVLKADAKLINTVNKKMKQILHKKFSAILFVISSHFFVFCFRYCTADLSVFILILHEQDVSFILVLIILWIYSGFRGLKITIRELMEEKRIGRCFRSYTLFQQQTFLKVLGSNLRIYIAHVLQNC